jgi:hypothetical protein
MKFIDLIGIIQDEKSSDFYSRSIKHLLVAVTAAVINLD